MRLSESSRASVPPWLPPIALSIALVGCGPSAPAPSEPPSIESSAPPVPGGMDGAVLVNRFAYIPAQCYTATRATPASAAHNPCYACHVHSTAPNFVDDADLQLTYSLPAAAAVNPWRNLFAPPVTTARALPDADVLARVRAGNYFDAAGAIALATALAALPDAWDGEHDHHWDGYVPDAWFHFDERGFDHAPDGAATGWRAFAYAPFLGTFFPTNGSADDVLIRLDPSLRQDATGRFSRAIYEANLAVVEALITRADVAIDPTDETALGADLDLDGVLGRATRVAFRAGRAGKPSPMRWVGRARGHKADGAFPLEPGLFPLGTEFLHSVRYLDVNAAGEVTMAARMKELRYAKKVRWLSPAQLKAHAAADATEQAESADGWIDHLWQHDRGIYNSQGWLLQGFIEAADGRLRPQSYEESLTCAGCHGDIGATTDSVFSFARKLGRGAPARGWFHWSAHDLRGLPEPRRRDGRYEYTFYLEQNGAGDELRDNDEIRARFFADDGRLRPERVAALHRDMATLLLPSPARAIALDRAYLAIVGAQSFTAGRDVVLAPSRNVHRRAPVGQKTGIELVVAGPEEPDEPAHTN